MNEKKTIKLPKLPPEQPMMIKAKRLARSLLKAHRQEEKDGRGCGKLLLEWVKECFWGAIIKEHIPVFDEVWSLLEKGGHTKKNPFGYGDADHDVWIEYPKAENKKVIVSICYCSCADDNTHIFIYDHPPAAGYDIYDWSKFRVATVWPRQINCKLGIDWGDDRDVDKPSLITYRKRDWRYGYYDCRDKGHCFIYEAHNKRAEKACWSESKLEHSLWVLRSHLSALKANA